MENGEHGAGGDGRVALRCVCGYRISCEVQPAGERIGFLEFFF